MFLFLYSDIMTCASDNFKIFIALFDFCEPAHICLADLRYELSCKQFMLSLVFHAGMKVANTAGKYMLYICMYRSMC